MFKKILVANRGEIACRVIRTARRMGIRTVAVYSDADRNARHVELADEAVPIGPAPSRESYLREDAIVEACRLTRAQAVHPGYGFLSENAAFCERIEREGIVFIGPKAHSMRAMGDKISSKKLALAAGVNTIPGHNDAIETASEAVRIAAAIGYPVMIKASAGGGGKGLRVASDDAACAQAWESCRNEARNAFGDERVFIEKYVEQPRHIEIQVLGDAHGNLVYLWERECSIQRRHQKVLEEAPSSFLDEKTRHAMGRQAVALARAVNYQSAGTVEFVVSRDRSFYFLEMNTRLQVEHPVTEMITGLDLVELMIRAAAGERLPLAQEDVRLEGWAIECRINAEDPLRNFLPSTGRLVRYLPPPEAEGAVRVDTGVQEGGEIPVHYDPMIAKLIAHGASRSQAITRMRDALNAFVIRGVSSNIAFQAALLQHPRFLAGDFDTGFMNEEYPEGFSAAALVHDDPLLLAAVAAFARRRYIDRAVRTSGQLHGHGRKVGNEWTVLMGDRSYALTLDPIDGGYAVMHDGQTCELKSAWRLGEFLFRGTWNGEPVCLQLERIGLRYRVCHWGTQADMMVVSARAAHLLSLMPDKPAPDLSRFLLSPMPGLLTEVPVRVGQEVKAGEKLAAIEAMKMENILKAERDCTVAEVMAKRGDNLAVDQPILRFA
ncbi:MAG TPA: acetyl/propionyl-CoA carboxylase subunit alpha [Rhodocyclaceae bacterium]|nr:MAG: acetyl/propionyl-CoA carboxylase subunit alpha [Rhodocyclales bacterium CG17_big_fil_post_rev_8_21_14_2_50_68_7]PJA57517.1 MAG: acetyl/propionyl-CoA carboxylase subunit alpha [Rhodocyclales bacterium CG_4_9_14_3_um_filter_68_10]HCX34275.1 acetyl/propionyl-CoA carboxylase subunit alpha [Rhodocyclaceae bacterium]